MKTHKEGENIHITLHIMSKDLCPYLNVTSEINNKIHIQIFKSFAVINNTTIIALQIS